MRGEEQMERERGQARTGVITVFLGIFFLIALIAVAMWGLPSYNRYQKRQDAQNQVAVNHINIQSYAQQVFIAKQQAQIRLQNAIGIRKAQDEISKTLTPLYVQFEMVDALKSIATSGTNSSVIYIPSGPNGIPLVGNITGNKVH
jgi:flagellar basal body-associated protein FliL